MPKNQVPQHMNDKQRIPWKYQDQRMIFIQAVVGMGG